MSKISLDEVEINGQVYVKKGAEYQPDEKLDGMNYVIIRKEARRIWYWSGASSISQLAEDGTAYNKERIV